MTTTRSNTTINMDLLTRESALIDSYNHIISNYQSPEQISSLSTSSLIPFDSPLSSQRTTSTTVTQQDDASSCHQIGAAAAQSSGGIERENQHRHDPSVGLKEQQIDDDDDEEYYSDDSVSLRTRESNDDDRMIAQEESDGASERRYGNLHLNEQRQRVMDSTAFTIQARVQTENEQQEGVIESRFPPGQPFNYPPLPQSIVENETMMNVLHSWYYCGYQTGLYDGYHQAKSQLFPVNQQQQPRK